MGTRRRKGSYLLQKSKEHANAKKHVNMLLLHDAETGNSHYCWIKESESLGFVVVAPITTTVARSTTATTVSKASDR
eukprot:SAG11_NODE_19041_length_472_cov_1.234043_1_plen_76_part_10